MQIFWTIISGVSIYVFGQIVQAFIIKPMHDFKIVLGEISHKVKYHSNIITNSGIKLESINWSSKEMRDLSCQLESRYLVIPFNDFWGLIKLIPKRKDVREATYCLNQLSNAGGMHGYELKNVDAIEKLKNHLGIVL